MRYIVYIVYSSILLYTSIRTWCSLISRHTLRGGIDMIRTYRISVHTQRAYQVDYTTYTYNMISIALYVAFLLLNRNRFILIVPLGLGLLCDASTSLLLYETCNNDNTAAVVLNSSQCCCTELCCAPVVPGTREKVILLNTTCTLCTYHTPRQ